MWKLLAILITFSFSGTAVGQRDTLCWMQGLDDSSLITELSIPGTHDSAADHYHCSISPHCKPVIEYVSTQTYRISDQLSRGVRFFDIRVSYEHGYLKLHHGVYELEQYLSDAIKAAIDHLDLYPSEFVIFLVKQEHSDVSGDDFWQAIHADIDHHIDNHEYTRDRLYFYKTVPKVGDVRGKIIFMARNYSQEHQGFHVEWPDNSKYYEGKDGELRYVVEDHYSLNEVHTDTKFAEIQQILSLAQNSMSCGDPNTLYITFLSGEGDGSSEYPRHYANYENPHTAAWLRNRNNPWSPRVGIIAMDYADDVNHGGHELMSAVIEQNIFLSPSETKNVPVTGN